MKNTSFQHIEKFSRVSSKLAVLVPTEIHLTGQHYFLILSDDNSRRTFVAYTIELKRNSVVPTKPPVGGSISNSERILVFVFSSVGVILVGASLCAALWTARVYYFRHCYNPNANNDILNNPIGDNNGNHEYQNPIISTIVDVLGGNDIHNHVMEDEDSDGYGQVGSFSDSSDDVSTSDERSD